MFSQLGQGSITPGLAHKKVKNVTKNKYISHRENINQARWDQSWSRRPTCNNCSHHCAPL